MVTASDERYPKIRVPVLDRSMALVDVGTGRPIVFVHGNPTSSYLWRNVIPHVEGFGRCIAPDLIGMGDSEKLEPSGPDRYRFAEHRRYLDALLDLLGIYRNVVLVLHDWGSVLGFDWARRHPAAVSAVAYMEAIVDPFRWSDWPEGLGDLFRAFRGPAGEKLILDENAFVERLLPAAVARGLTDAEMQVYRRPYSQPGESRRPTLTWPRELPIEGEPAETTRIVREAAQFMAGAPFPKLLVRAEPGAILVGEKLAQARRWKHQEEVAVPGGHFLPEDAPAEVGRALAAWLRRVG